MSIILVLLLFFQLAPGDWLLAQQNAEGAWQDGLGERGGYGITVDALIALWAVEAAPPPNTRAFLTSFANRNATTLTPAQAAKLTLAARVLGENPTRFGGVDLTAVMLGGADDGLRGGSVYAHCLIVLALHSADLAPPQDDLSQYANTDGGWGFAPAAPSDTSTTALCIQAALATAQPTRAALQFLRQNQNPDGGWRHLPNSQFAGGSEAYATAAALMALTAAEEDWNDWNNPQNTLLKLQTPDGSFTTGNPWGDLLATAQAIPALAGVSLLDLR